MISSCVLVIGKEVISGVINDTNSFFISCNLTKLGIYNRYIVAVDDESDDIISVFLSCLKEVEIIITTGGLGPTFDDITISSVAKALKRKLILSEKSYKRIEKFYYDLYKKGKIDSKSMNDKRKKMAYVPEDSIELTNSVGAANGIYIKEKNKHIFCLPGIPKEMEPLFEREVAPILKTLSKGVTISKTYEFEINDETILGQFIDKIREQGVYIKSLPIGFDSKTIGVRFTAFGKDEKECLDKIEKTKNTVLKYLDEYI